MRGNLKWSPGSENPSIRAPPLVYIPICPSYLFNG